MSLSRVLAAFALVVGLVGFWVSFSAPAGAVSGITYYVNSPVDTSATDCTTAANTDCGIDDAIGDFDSDTNVNDADVIDFASGSNTFQSSATNIANATSGVTLSIEGDGSTMTTVTGSFSNSVFKVQNATVTIDGLTITRGDAPAGGGVYNFGNVALTNDTLSDDVAVSSGGAVFNEGTATLTNDTMDNDSSSNSGGAVSNFNIATLTNDSIINANAQGGGGVYNVGTATLTNDTISSDTAWVGGGVENNSSVTMENDTLADDASSIGGGGIFSLGSVTLTNDTLVDDTSPDGGGLMNDGGATLTNDTLANDIATASGGGVYNGSALTIANSIFSTASCTNSSAITDDGYNVESDATCGSAPSDVTNSTSINLATVLAANGSSGPETLAIGPTSSAFEAVPPSNCSTVTSDERGASRPGVLSAFCDAGAYEYQLPPPVVVPRSAQVITFAALQNVTFGVVALSLSPSASSGLTVALVTVTPEVCDVSGFTLEVLAVGTCTIVASQAGDDRYLPAADVTQSFNVDAVAKTLRVPGRPHIRGDRSLSSGRVVLVVSRPPNGGSRLRGYEYSIDGRTWVNAPLGGHVDVPDLSPHHVVALRVRARNAVGISGASNTVRVTIR